MLLSQLLKGIATIEADINITGLQIDSRKVKAGDLFVAIKGTQVDGHDYIQKAIEQGAAAILCGAVSAQTILPTAGNTNIPILTTSSTEAVIGQVAHTFYGSPTEHLTLVGVTGTNGKTTIATTLYHLFRRFGHKVGLLSTVCNYIDDQEVEATQTTPDPISLNRMLAEMVAVGCAYAFMEVSSHAVAQHRIGGLHFKGGIFTNLTRDHLDYHKTFEGYRNAKKGFFDALPKEAFALTNADDDNGLFMVQNCPATRKTYSLRTLTDFKARIIEAGFDGMLLEVDGRQVAVRFVGKFNAYNLLAVYGTAVLLGKEREETLLHLSALAPVAGRFEPLRSADGVLAIVDYAHTPDALINVLEAIRPLIEGEGQLITVVGCGGNRDKGKRPLMAQEAARRSDRLILTSDNPRFEQPEDIINDMQGGLSPEEASRTLRITDRREAIRTAVALARKGDVILIAGKGHEPYQEVQGVKHHFDDKEEWRGAVSAQTILPNGCRVGTDNLPTE
jgi:UDP-N-acetylmuramoyl-L-alanyl-D-glutamate--2,6-diaminopimelate ligase